MAVRVVSGASAQNVDMAGKTIGEIRSFMTQALNIGSGAQALVTGHSVGDDHVVAEGDQVEFVREAGEKG